MSMDIYHILGADIPHHNHSVLTFFNEQISSEFTENAHHYFFVVGGSEFNNKYATLNIRLFANKKVLAEALRHEYRGKERFFLFHGQYNPHIWIDIALSRLPMSRVGWYIWGADLYEVSDKLSFKVFYPLRRFAQKKIRYVYGTKGDLNYFSKYNQQAIQQLLYFPTKMMADLDSLQTVDEAENIEILDKKVAEKAFSIMIGNSGDSSNQHQVALKYVAEKLGRDINVVLPMGYPANNQHYIQKVEATARKYFPEECIHILKENLQFDEYLQLLKQIDCAYFAFPRQQGIGTICLLIALNIPMILNKDNPFCDDLSEQQLPYLLEKELSKERLIEITEQLLAMNKSTLAFFPQNYRKLWLEILSNIENLKLER